MTSKKSAAQTLRNRERRAAAFAIWRVEQGAKLGRSIVTKMEAEEGGFKRYFTGRPCKKGHFSERWTISTDCVRCGREATVKWEKSNPEKARDSARIREQRRSPQKREYHQRTKAKRQKVSREWYEANKERRGQQISEWQKRNPEILRAVKHNYRNKLRNAGTHTADDIKNLLETQKGKCAHPWCRKPLSKGYHVDHRVPVSRGGRNDRLNIQLLCKTCNLRKSAKHPEAFAQENGYLV